VQPNYQSIEHSILDVCLVSPVNSVANISYIFTKGCMNAKQVSVFVLIPDHTSSSGG
jgi:hypothetical protein